MASTLDKIITKGVDGWLKDQRSYIARSNALKVQREFAIPALRKPPVLSNWCPQGYMFTSTPPITYTPSIPGRIQHERYGNCYIHAACEVIREYGEHDHTIYLVTLVDAVKTNGYYITSKRKNWYEVPSTLVVSGDNLYGFCGPVPCMIDTVDYDPTNPGGSLVTLVYRETPSKPVVMTLTDVIASTDKLIKLAFENFKFDYKAWVVEKNIEHIPIPDASTDGGDNNSGSGV